jgi:RNA polymerase sigma factor (TIGR02999 family)
MRQVLVTHAVHRRAAKRGHGWRQIALDDVVALFEAQTVDLVALDEALCRLAELDGLQAQIVELRFFGGLAMEAVAEVTGLTQRTAEREWSIARAWLRRELTRD